MDDTVIQVKIFWDASEDEINRWLMENDISQDSLVDIKFINTSLSLKVVIVYEVPAE